MSKIKSMVHNGDINIYAINEYKIRLDHYNQILTAVDKYNLIVNVKCYSKLIRIYKILYNAIRNLEEMIDNLYHARRVIQCKERFYPYGKNSPLISKYDFMTSMINRIEEALKKQFPVLDRTDFRISHCGSMLHDQLYLAVGKILTINEYDMVQVDKVSDSMLVFRDIGYMDDFVILHTVMYLKLISGLLNTVDSYEHEYYIYIKNLVIDTTSKNGVCLLSLDEHPDLYIHILEKHIGL